MLNKFKRLLFLTAAIATFPLVASMSAIAQEPPAEEMPDAAEPAETEGTVCQYDPDSGFPNALGMRSYITITEADGNTTFVLDRFAAPLANPENADQQADVTEERSLTLYNIGLDDARQLMIDQPFYYAELLEVDGESLTLDFTEVDKTLACEVAESEPSVEPEPAEPTPTPEPSEPDADSGGLDLSALPNGNYRVVSADFPNRIVSDEELLEAGGVMFLFRKFGDEVTGVYSFIDNEGGSCIVGTLEGNTVTGEAFAYSENVREGTFLTLGSPAGGGRYPGSVLNLDSASRINAGSRLPVESCP